jgi:tRNA pseudouridine13 synthase
MKLKQQPEDFQVEELTDIVPVGEGPYALYRLRKRGWATPDAVGAIRRRWDLALRSVSYGGLKDRHAQTIQYLTILRGPQRGLTHHGVVLEYLGQVLAPYTSKDIRANRFRITLRALEPAVLPAVEQAVDEVRADGVANYFDDQRFGSVGPQREFVARALVLGHFEEALRLALAAPYAHDRAAAKQEKAILRTHWGDWAALKERLPRGHARSLADYLAHHPDDYRGAVARLRPELRGLYLSAYQSYLWNQMLARWLEEHCRPEQILRVRLRLGEVPLYRRLDPTQQAELAGLTLPLPTARLKLEPQDRRAPLVQHVLAGEGLELRQLKVKGLREVFFSKGERLAVCQAARLTAAAASDDRHPGRHRLVLSFELPRGCYATMVIKRIMAATGTPDEDEAMPDEPTDRCGSST